MTLTKRVLVFDPSNTFAYSLPLLMLNFQRHYEDNGKYVKNWEWIDPIVDFNYDTIDQLADQIIDTNPDVLALGMYVWSEVLCLEVAKRVKQYNPKCWIVIGGPQSTFIREIDWFKKHPFVDYACSLKGYGEWFMTPFLDCVYEGIIKETEIPLLIKPKSIGYELVGTIPDPRSYVWQKNIYSKDDLRLQRWVDAARLRGDGITALVETTRGCPFSCTYCEWGGGIGTKVVKKPSEEVYLELETLASLDIDNILLADANFGMFDRDVEFVHQIVNLKNTFGVPKSVYVIGPAKTNEKNVNTINEILLNADLNHHWNLNIQHLDPVVVGNIKRVDTPWQKRIYPYIEVSQKYNKRISTQMISPLPGHTLQHFYDEIDFMAKYNTWSTVIFELQILPGAELADQEQIDQWGMILRLYKENILPKAYVEDDETGSYSLMIDTSRVEISAGLNNDLRKRFIGKSYVCIGNNSITPQDWVDTRLLYLMSTSMELYGIFSDLTDWLKMQGTPHSEYYKKFYQWVKKPSQSRQKSNVWHNWMKKIRDDWLGDDKEATLNQNWPLTDYPFLLDGRNIFWFGFASDDELVTEWTNWVEIEFGHQAGDLARTTQARLLSTTTDCIEGRNYTSDWDWRPWIYMRQNPMQVTVSITWFIKKFGTQDIPIFKYATKELAEVWLLRYATRLYNALPVELSKDNLNWVAWEYKEIDTP
jgi:hypothetical protein